jgi:hypothetical protein
MDERDGTGWTPAPGEVVLQTPGSPSGVLPAQLADQGLGLWDGLVRTGAGPVGAISE